MIEAAVLEALLRELGSGVALWRLDEPAAATSLRLVLANAAASRWAGVDLAGGAGQRIGEIDPRAVALGLHERLAAVARSGVAAALETPPDAVAPRAPARAVPLAHGCVALIIEQADAHRRAEEDAERLATFLDSIVENIPAMVFAKDAGSLRYLLFNRGAERITGRPRQDVLGRNAIEAGVPPDQAASFEAKDREVLRKGDLVDIPEEPVAMKTGEQRWLHTKKIPIAGADGQPRYLLGISLDITDRKVATLALQRAHEELECRVAQRTAELQKANAELRHEIEERQRAEATLERTEAQLRQAQKMEAVGRLAGGVAHDFNNLLSVIVGSTSMLEEDDTLNAQVHQDLAEIRRAGERAAELTRQLLAFSRQQVRAPTALNLNTVIARMDRMLRRVIGEDIELVSVQAPDLHTIQADAGQIEQVLMNLVVNSRDAMPSGGRLVLETANVDVDDAFSGAHVGLSPGAHVMLAVADTGVGMDASTQELIFEPFFTTKGPGQGTGLGLPTVFGIVKQSGGGIFVESAPGAGATFRCYFPRSDEPAAASAPPADRPVRGHETLLVVEDDDQVRALVVRILKSHGYEVIEAPGPEEALALAARREQRIDLVITDVVMRQMNGRELAQRLRVLRPGTEIVFMSGYSAHVLDQDGVLAPGLRFLQKPITPAALTQAVRTALDAARR